MEDDKYPYWSEDLALVWSIAIACHVEGLDPYKIVEIVVREVSDWRNRVSLVRSEDIEKGHKNISKSKE